MFIYVIVDYAFDELLLGWQLPVRTANRSSSIALAWLVASVQQLFNIVDELVLFHVHNFSRSLRQTQSEIRR